MCAVSEYRNIARVTKTQGLNGEVVVVPIDGLPFLLSEGMECFLTPPPLRGIRSAKVLSLRERSHDWVVAFQGVDSLEEAHAIVGRTCLVACSDLPDDIDELLQEEDGISWTLGMRVIDATAGDIGTVEEILETKAGFLWSVMGEKGEVLIPVVDEFIADVDEEAETIRVELPAGLVELNAPRAGKQEE